MSKVFILVLLVLPMFSYAETNAYFDDRQRGYYFYEDPPVESEIEKQEDVPRKVPAPEMAEADKKPAEEDTQLDKLKEMGKQWEEGMALAILDPSIQNVRDWMQLHTQIISQANSFATNVKETVWVTPEFDSRIKNPVRSDMILDQGRKEKNTLDVDLEKIAREKGLLYVFRSDCPYCAKFSPLIKRFASSYGFGVLAISLDGKGVPEYPRPKMPNEFVGQLNVDVVPAVYLVDPNSNDVVPASFGYVDLNKLRVKVEHAANQFEHLRNVLATSQ